LAALRRHRVAVQVTQLGENSADPVEGARDDMGAARDPAFQRLGLPLHPEILLRLRGVLIAVRVAVAGVLAEPSPECRDLAILAAGAAPSGWLAGAVAGPARRPLAQIDVLQPGAHGGGQVAA